MSFYERTAEERALQGEVVADFAFNEERIRALSGLPGDVKSDSGGVVYWMSRDQRIQDNWALIYAQRLALRHGLPLFVCFCLQARFLGATARHFKFMLGGLAELETEACKLNIAFRLLRGAPQDALPTFVTNNNVGCVVTDFSPLRISKEWVRELSTRMKAHDVPMVQVDAHNIVPVWVTSDKQEYAARTIRNKIHKHLGDYLTAFPAVTKHPVSAGTAEDDRVDWHSLVDQLEVDNPVQECTWIRPGATAAFEMLESFCTKRLRSFAEARNDPTKDALSNMSPYFHFGHISVQRAVLAVKAHRKSYAASVDAFVEEAVVRRELSDNFCHFNPNYDNLLGAANWAQITLNQHKQDAREHTYTLQQFELAKTHDQLWNAAQRQLTREGKMHGFMRMYWAKKILEWTKSPEQALEFAIYLNDRYSLDGRDPNGYVGCMWSICGVHDQGWAERAVFGKIRYMNYKGCQRKFDVARYIRKYPK